MIGQMKALLRIKELKQEKALSAMRAKQVQTERARIETQEALQIAESFRETMPARENQIYDEVMGRIVDVDGIDDVRAKIVELEKEYIALKDDWDRARQIEQRLEDELVEAINTYRTAVRNRDKYITITETMQAEADDEATRKEEIEIEDLFSRPMRRIA
ncbi:type III secretion system stalk subunit SctO [Pseudochelatococcus sp. G4_1912]|uniref:type III secretion system stalk subunit SctO n=1 Tax=Pseudochelatococcus sp. G4_1912 TaxID=3114288 RepID=UPI0039C7202E